MGRSDLGRYNLGALKPDTWTTWADDDKCSILSSYVPSAGSNLIPGFRTHFASIMTLNNYEIIAETRSYIFG